MCAIDLPRQNAADIVDAMLAEGYLINNTTPRTLRFLPPLVVSAEQLDGLLAALRRTLSAARRP
jgi:acetylornithine aminotransferase